MADFSIDQDNLPGVKDVCRDFAVLEDHCLAHSLQEQEIENHLASNVNKSRLMQKDLRVAKRMQEEEDHQAKSHDRRQRKDAEQSDNEIAQVIQDQLVRQAERQRQQEKKDAAMARKLQEKEMKEGKKRKKQQGASSVEPYREEKGGWNAEGDYNMTEVIQGVNHLDMQDQEILDMEVARRLHEEELKANQEDLRAAQVAQDEEIARLMMEEEERKGYKPPRDQERRGPDGERRTCAQEVVRPRLKEDCESPRPRSQKPARPPPPAQNYENVDSSSPRKPARPEPAYKGSQHRQ